MKKKLNRRQWAEQRMEILRKTNAGNCRIDEVGTPVMAALLPSSILSVVDGLDAQRPQLAVVSESIGLAFFMNRVFTAQSRVGLARITLDDEQVIAALCIDGPSESIWFVFDLTSPTARIFLNDIKKHGNFQIAVGVGKKSVGWCEPLDIGMLDKLLAISSEPSFEDRKNLVNLVDWLDVISKESQPNKPCLFVATIAGMLL